MFHMPNLSAGEAALCEKAFRDRLQGCTTAADILDAFAAGRPT